MYRLFGEEMGAFAPSLDFIDARSNPKDAAEVREVLDRAAANKQPYFYRRRIRHKNGSWHTLESHGKVICNDAGEAIFFRGVVQDVTERVAAENKLQAYQELLHNTINSSQDLIQVFKAVRSEAGEVVDFRWVLNNQAAEQVYGNVIGKSLLENNPGVVQEGIFDTFKTVVETGIPDQSERHYVHEQFCGWFYQSTVKQDDGVVTTTRNITKRKKAEQELLASKNLLQGIIDTPNLGIAVYKALRNPDGSICDFVHEFINKRTLEALGGHNMTGKLLSDHGEARSKQIKDFAEVLETGNQNSYTIQRELLGSNRWIRISNARLDSERLVHVWDDVTEQNEKNQELLRLKDEIAQQATDKYKALFNTVAEGFSVVELIYDAEENPIDMRWVEVNHAFERITNLKDVAGRLFSDFFPSEQYWVDTCHQVLKTGEAVIYENFHAGTNLWFRTHTSRIGGQGSRLIMNLFEDVTERKTKEQQQAFMSSFSDLLRNESGPDAVAAKALQLLNDFLRLDRSYIVTYYLNENRAELNYQIGNETVPPLPEHFNLSHYPETYKTVLDKTLVIEDEFERLGLSEEEKRNSEKLGMRAMVAATIRKGENTPLWSLVAMNARPRRWSRPEIELIEEIAERTWAALERAKAIKAVYNSEGKYRTLFDSMDEGYCIIEMLFDEKRQPYDWRFLEVNPAFEKNNGLSNATGKTILELTPNIESKWFDIYGQVALTGEPRRFEEDSPALNRWFSLFAFRVGLPEERKVAVLFNDITKRRNAEVALKKSEEQFRKAIEDAPIPVIMHAEDGEVLQISRTWTELTGYSLEEVPTFEHWLTQAYGEGADKVRAFMQQLFVTDNNNLSIDFPVRTRAKGLRYWSFSVSSPGVLADGRRFIVGMAVDITERRLSEEKLREFNRTLEQQVSERTRELIEVKLNQQKLLLIAILEAQEEERRRISESLHNGVAQILYATKMSLNNMAGLVAPATLKPTEDFLAEAISETRRVSHELVPVMLKDFGLTAGINDLCRRFSISELNINCTVQGLPEKLDLYLEVAIYRICQELMNNIVKHARARNAEIKVCGLKTEIQILAQDNGIGIQEKKKNPGIGLRSISDRVKLLNGNIETGKPESGKGTRVFIRIPLEE